MSSKMPLKIILGTHTIGDIAKGSGLTHFDDEKDVQALLDAFQARGYNEIDTARDYSANAPGASEIRLGKAGAPSRFTVHTKVHSGEPGAHQPVNVHLSIEQSLASLKTSTVETMFLHVPDRHTPFEDTAKAMNDAFQQGKFRKFGLSNYTAAEVQKFLDICEQNGYVKPTVFEGHYNPVARGGEKELFPLLRKHNIAFFAYSPAAGGLFSGHAHTSARWDEDTPIGKIYNSHYGSVLPLVGNVLSTAESHLNGKYGDGVIFGVSKLEQLHKTLDALESGPLPGELAEAISAIYSRIEDPKPPYHL
ncbi:hypothetical protein Plec18167_004509 [Paecilomyces lecythidis]|uniref:NADP-dependent oxidoreductase domain-containing protein n=1 Tax=Paecilomyces lecythidis TaxID=3004212 RepID=A0ABR3XS72_9EURO